MLEAGMTFSLGQLVIDDEIAGMVKRVVKGIAEQAQATIIDRRRRGAWEQRGSKSLIESANERARELLKAHEPKPLEEGLIKEMKRIIASAE
jgi:trimethylamine--corrinoid protein Co-methyltransferase